MADNAHVFLVGAGPGDPGLLTLKGKAAIEQADVLIYDRLVSPRLLEYAKPTCEMIYVGKNPNKHTLPQDEINALIASKATGNNIVVRLKGGDPFVFGRGGEEAEVLREQGIKFDIVPGVTSAVAAPAYAGIPVTHRRMASSFTVITGHEHADKDESSIPWEHVANLQGTLVFLMGMDNLPHIVSQLVAQGMDSQTPVAVVHYGTWLAQKTVCATLATIEERVHEEEIENPSVIVVGEVVTLRKRLQWFDTKPLFGKTIVVTRARHQASVLTAKLEALGANVLECPVIALDPPSDQNALGAAIDALDTYQWLIFTSANGVDAFFAEAQNRGADARSLAGIQVVAIGPGTKKALAHYGIYQVLLPEDYRAEGLVSLLSDKVCAGDSVLIARAEEARDVLPRALEDKGAHVSDVAAYRTRIAQEQQDTLFEALQTKSVDAITFTSSSTARNLMQCLEGHTSLLEDVALYSIGPITSTTLREAGFEPHGEASVYTIDGLIDSMITSQGGSR